MRGLSIRQPWAWAILNCGKRVENRSWRSNFRGEFLIHASKGMTEEDLLYGMEICRLNVETQGRTFEEPSKADLLRGGIVGRAVFGDPHLPGVLRDRWHAGDQYGYRLSEVHRLVNAQGEPAMVPWKGALGFFHIDDQVWQRASSGMRMEECFFHIADQVWQKASSGMRMEKCFP